MRPFPEWELHERSRLQRLYGGEMMGYWLVRLVVGSLVARKAAGARRWTRNLGDTKCVGGGSGLSVRRVESRSRCSEINMPGRFRPKAVIKKARSQVFHAHNQDGSEASGKLSSLLRNTDYFLRSSNREKKNNNRRKPNGKQTGDQPSFDPSQCNGDVEWATRTARSRVRVRPELGRAAFPTDSGSFFRHVLLVFSTIIDTAPSLHAFTNTRNAFSVTS